MNKVTGVPNLWVVESVDTSRLADALEKSVAVYISTCFFLDLVGLHNNSYSPPKLFRSDESMRVYEKTH